MELDAERRADEVRLYQGFLGEEFVSVFLASAMDRPGHLSVRVMFCDLDGTPLEKCVLTIARTRTLAFRIVRLFKPDFVYPPKEQPDHRAAAPSNRRHVMS